MWTDHIHDDRKNLPAAPVAPAMQDTVATPDASNQDGPWSKLVSFAIVGLFVGFMLGAFIFNGLGATTPTTETTHWGFSAERKLISGWLASGLKRDMTMSFLVIRITLSISKSCPGNG